jgi:hypothetical protein
LQWHIERLENGRYKIYARGAPTAAIDGLLYALLVDEEKAEEWIITKPRNGEHGQYT